MPAQFWHRGQQLIDGPKPVTMDGPAWDRVEATYLCVGSNPSANGGFKHGDPFPGMANFWIDTIESTPCADGGYLCRVTGKGYKTKRVYTTPVTYAQSEQHGNVTIAGVPGPVGGAWPVADLLLPQVGLRQVIVGAPNISHGLQNLGKAVNAPAEGSFPPAPASPFTSIANPVLHYPWGWVLARMEADSARPGNFAQSGPWLVIYEYVHRWKITPG